MSGCQWYIVEVSPMWRVLAVVDLGRVVARGGFLVQVQLLVVQDLQVVLQRIADAPHVEALGAILLRDLSQQLYPGVVALLGAGDRAARRPVADVYGSLCARGTLTYPLCDWLRRRFSLDAYRALVRPRFEPNRLSTT